MGRVASARALPRQLRRVVFGLGPGLAVAAALALLAQTVTWAVGGPALLYALAGGMALNAFASRPRLAPGLKVASTTILRVGVALLGARIGLDQLASLGAGGLILTAGALVATIGFGVWLARRLSMTRDFGLLTGGATAICGASAAMTIAAVLPRHEKSERDTLFAVVAVTTLSTVAMVIYPVIAVAFDLDRIGAGLFLGGSIHDVAQVVGAGYVMSEPIGDLATLTKLFRVALLVPVTLAIAVLVSAQAKAASAGESNRLRVPTLPWFLIVFVALAAATSVHWLPLIFIDGASQTSRACLIIAIAATGMRTPIASMRSLGWKPVLLVTGETVFIAAVVLLGVLGLAAL